MKVAVEYANRFRYCEYLGKYFCTGCHTNQVALIPGKILSKWDFNRYVLFEHYLMYLSASFVKLWLFTNHVYSVNFIELFNVH